MVTDMNYTFIYRGLMVLYGLYVLFVEVVGNGRLVRHGVNKALFTLFILVWFAWLFVSFEVPYGWGHDAMLGRLWAIEPAWLRSGLWGSWVILTFCQVVVPHLLYRSRRAGDGLVALVLVVLLTWIISPLNNFYNIL